MSKYRVEFDEWYPVFQFAGDQPGRIRFVTQLTDEQKAFVEKAEKDFVAAQAMIYENRVEDKQG